MKELLEAGVSTDLRFYDKNNALAGKIGNLGVVIKENNETKSYGVLMWAKAPAEAAPNELSELLGKQVAAKPHIIKHFKATGRGAALALVKYNDAGRNIRNIKRFMTELSDELTKFGYSNCCYRCGMTNDLAIYQDGASVVQLCPRCKKGELLCDIGTSPAPMPRPVPEKPAEAPEDNSAYKEKNEKPAEPVIPEPKPVEVKPEEKPIETKPEEEPVEAKTEEKPAEAKTEEKTVEVKPEEIPVEAKPEDTPVEAAAEDKSAEPKPEEIPVETKAEEKPVEEKPVETKPEEEPAEPADVPTELLADAAAAVTDAVDTDNIISSNDDKTDISSLMAEDEPAGEKEAPPKSEIFEAAQREFDEQKRNAGPEKDEALNSLMFDENAKKEEKPAAWGGMPVIEEPKDTANIDGLMYDGTEAPEAEETPVDIVDSEEKAEIGGLMLDADSVAEAEGEDYTAASAAAARAGATVTEVTEIGNIGGTGEELVVTAADEEEVGESDEIEVTALYDDSDEGVDIEIEESVSEFGMPTDTSGEPIVSAEEKAAETNNAPKGRKPMEVRAFAYGSYENATATEEPVGFDGRRKGDEIGGDPRMGDEMGSRSRNYAAQQAASPIHDVSKVKAPTVVEKRAAAGSRIDNRRYANTYTTSSNALMGTIAALLFGLIAGAIWVLSGNLFDAIGMDGQVSLLIQSILGALIPIGAFLGYRVGGDAFDGKGIIISSIISVVLGGIGYVAVLVTAEVRSTEAEYAYSISLETAINNVTTALGDLGSHPDMVQRIGISAAALIIALVVSIIVAKKKSE